MYGYIVSPPNATVKSVSAVNAVFNQTSASLPAYLTALTAMLTAATKSTNIFSSTYINGGTTPSGSTISGLTKALALITNIALTDPNNNGALYVTETPTNSPNLFTLSGLSTLLSTQNFINAVKAWRSLKAAPLLPLS